VIAGEFMHLPVGQLACIATHIAGRAELAYHTRIALPHIVDVATLQILEGNPRFSI